MLTGLSPSGCMRASTLDAMQYGFVPYVVREACGHRDAGPHEANLFDLQAKYAEVVSEVRALELLGATCHRCGSRRRRRCRSIRRSIAATTISTMSPSATP